MENKYCGTAIESIVLFIENEKKNQGTYRTLFDKISSVFEVSFKKESIWVDVSAEIDNWQNLQCRVKGNLKTVWLTSVDGGHFWAKDIDGHEELYLAGYGGVYSLETKKL